MSDGEFLARWRRLSRETPAERMLPISAGSVRRLVAIADALAAQAAGLSAGRGAD